jgi:hypothetical protein
MDFGMFVFVTCVVVEHVSSVYTTVEIQSGPIPVAQFSLEQADIDNSKRSQ